MVWGVRAAQCVPERERWLSWWCSYLRARMQGAPWTVRETDRAICVKSGACLTAERARAARCTKGDRGTRTDQMLIAAVSHAVGLAAISITRSI